jgi:uncharacterized protein
MVNIQRAILQSIMDRIRPGKAILLYGARRVGKTVLLKQIEKVYTGKVLRLNGEDADSQTLLSNRSSSHYRNILQGIDLLILDEAQNLPDVGNVLKLIVDEVEGISVIASGSSSFDLLNLVGEPLVGRAHTFYLFPFSQEEISQIENPLQIRQNLEQRLVYGSYPETLHMKNDERKEYLNEIVHSYLLKDILAMDGIRNSEKMRNLLRLISFQSGSLVSYDELGKQLGMSKNTVERYLDLLSKVFVIHRLGVYSANLRKEVTKASKWYFFDNGIRNALIGNFSPMALRNDAGALWESYLISERLKKKHFHRIQQEHFFWRTYDGQELDLVEKTESGLQGFEFKWGGKTPRCPVAFAKAYSDAKFQVINPENYLEWLSL